MRAAEHIAFANDARRDSDGGDGGVELRMRRRKEEFFEEGTPVLSSLPPILLWYYSFALAGAWCWGKGLRYVDNERKLMHEFIFPPILHETAQPINHIPTYAPADPDIAVDDPHDIAFRFAVSAAHVPDLGVWA